MVEILKTILQLKSLDRIQSADIMHSILTEQVAYEQIGAFLTALTSTLR